MAEPEVVTEQVLLARTEGVAELAGKSDQEKQLPRGPSPAKVAIVLILSSLLMIGLLTAITLRLRFGGYPFAIYLMRGQFDRSLPHENATRPQLKLTISPPDELKVVIKPATEDATPSTVVVQPDGLIDLGFVGSVYVVGLTPAEAEERIAEHLDALPRKEGEPKEKHQVSVRLANNQSKFYYVLGSVGNQGRYKLTGEETVLDAIMQSTLRSNSKPDKAFLVRPSNPEGEGTTYFIDWEAITEKGDVRTNYQILPGDRIVVPGGPPEGLLSDLFGFAKK